MNVSNCKCSGPNSLYAMFGLLFRFRTANARKAEANPERNGISALTKYDKEERMCPHEEEGQQSEDQAAFNPVGFEYCLIAAQDDFVRIVNELMVRRKRLDVTQRQLATALDMSPSRISEIECMNNTDVSLMRTLLICQALGARLEFRITNSEHALFAKDNTKATVTPQGTSGSVDEEQPSIGHRGNKNYGYIASLQSTKSSEESVNTPKVKKTNSSKKNSAK